MKYIFIYIVLVSQCYMQIRLTLDGNSSYGNKDISAGLSFSYDKELAKQGNVKLGVGLEHMLSRDIDDDKFQSNNYYLFMRYIYEKKWSSYLRLGYNRLSGIDNLSSRNGLLCGFGVAYKLNDKWYIETGYHINSTNDKYSSRMVYSISRYFNKKDDDEL